MPVMTDDNVLVWGKDLIEDNTIAQAEAVARLPFVAGHVALMPDAHVGKGSSVGTVIPTKGAIIPAAVGVDLGCGLAAVKLDITQENTPDLEGLMSLIEQAIPAGVGQGHEIGSYADEENSFGMDALFGRAPEVVKESTRLTDKMTSQCGTLGSGNHFFEVSVGQDGHIWLVLHSGSRGVGNILAQSHIKTAEALMAKWHIELGNPDLSYLAEDTPEFDHYIHDMLWAQDYAMMNRQVMLTAAYDAFKSYVDIQTGIKTDILKKINCHHNFTQLENHGNRNIWLTRKGAINAREDTEGIIPGSMGTDTYIVRGLGNPSSYNSCSHGAGRVHSRTRAKALYDINDMNESMTGKVWNANRGASLVDEISHAYKDISAVMDAQSDLVETTDILSQIFNYKG